METPHEQQESLGTSAARSTSNELIKLIRKLRWIGMDDEAERRLRELPRYRATDADSVLAMTAETD